MTLSDPNVYCYILGGLIEKPLLLSQYDDIVPEDFDKKMARIIFNAILSLCVNQNKTMLNAQIVEEEIMKLPPVGAYYTNNNGLAYLLDCIDYGKEMISQFDDFYKQLKKYSLLRELKSKHYDISQFYKEDFDSLKEEKETIERFEKADTTTILDTIDGNLNEIRTRYLHGGVTNKDCSNNIFHLIEEFEKTPNLGPDLNGDIFNIVTRGARPGCLFIKSASSSAGKAIPNSVRIPTPEGFKRVGDIKVGDYLFGPDGKKTKVLAVYPQKEQKRIYKIAFEDGRFAECCSEHLWEYFETFNGVELKKVAPLSELKKQFEKNYSDTIFSVRTNKPVIFKNKYEGFYELCDNCRITGVRAEDLLKKWDYFYDVIKNASRVEGVSFLEDEIDTIAVIKAIANQFGFITKLSFNTPRDPENEKFLVVLKRGKLKIDDIIETNLFEDMTCFTVDNESHLFLMNDYIVTHNTRTSVFDACKLAFPEYYSLVQGTFVKEIDNATGLIREPMKTLFIVTEMDNEEVQSIILAYLSKVNESHILTGQYEFDERDRVIHAAEIMKKYEGYLIIESISDPNLNNVSATIKRYALLEGVKNVFFDYIHSTPSLLAQFSSAKIREDVALMLLANQLKQLAKDYKLFIFSATQVNAEGMGDKSDFKNELCIRGAKSIIDKCDLGYVMSKVNEKDYLSLLKQIQASSGAIKNKKMLNLVPNFVLDVFKNRRGEYKNIRIWMKLDLGTGEREDLFMTTANNEPIPTELVKYSAVSTQPIRDWRTKK